MSNKQNFASIIMDNWNKKMQEYLNDPKVNELMVDCYAKFQQGIEEVAKNFDHQKTADDNDDVGVVQTTDERIDILEAKVKIIEEILDRFIHSSNRTDNFTK